MLLLASARRGGGTLKTQNNHNGNSSYCSNISRHRKDSKDSIAGTLGQDSTLSLFVCVRKESSCSSVETKSVAPRYNVSKFPITGVMVPKAVTE